MMSPMSVYILNLVSDGLILETRVGSLVTRENGSLSPLVLSRLSLFHPSPIFLSKDLASAQTAFVQLLGQIRPDSKLQFLQWACTEYSPGAAQPQSNAIMEEQEEGDCTCASCWEEGTHFPCLNLCAYNSICFPLLKSPPPPPPPPPPQSHTPDESHGLVPFRLQAIRVRAIMPTGTVSLMDMRACAHVPRACVLYSSCIPRACARAYSWT